MAVDVPESFIARNKTPPRYPPPRPPVQVNHIPNGAMPQVVKNPMGTNATVVGSVVGGGGVNLELQPLDSFGAHHHHSKSSPSLDSSNHDFSKKSSLKGPSSIGGSTCDSLGFDSMSYRTKSRGSLSTRSSSSGDFGPPEYDQGPHRELPVDVPDSFVEMKKAPPRYPPPKPQNVKDVVKNKSSLSSHGSWEEKPVQPQVPFRSNEVFFDTCHLSFLFLCFVLFYFIFTSYFVLLCFVFFLVIDSFVFFSSFCKLLFCFCILYGFYIASLIQ